jgi:hypothetical protein
MAHVIAEPCIGVKDTACVDVCPVDCNRSRNCTSIRMTVSIVERACASALSRRFSP